MSAESPKYETPTMIILASVIPIEYGTAAFQPAVRVRLKSDMVSTPGVAAAVK